MKAIKCYFLSRITTIVIILATTVFAKAQNPDSAQTKKRLEPSKYHNLRGGLKNSYLKFTNQKTGCVAFMGGSITEMNGWRDSICAYLQRRFPETKFEFIAAGIGSTGSTPGAFRLTNDVLSKCTPDLFFEEASVNDRVNGFGDTARIRGMEGIIRHMRTAGPQTDIVMMYFVDPPKMDDYNKGQTPAEISNHIQVAETYNVASINLAKEVTDRINAGEFSWKDDFKNLHPSPFGQQIYYRSIRTLLDSCWKNIDPKSKPTTYKLPAPIDPNSYTNGIYAELKDAKIVSNWTLVDNWKPTDGKGTRKGYANVPALVAEQPGAELSFSFVGNTFGICVAAGPDAGIVEYSVDNGPFKQQNLFTSWSKGLHIPWYYVLAAGLPSGKHTVTLKISADKDSRSVGTACRIIHFLVN